MIRNFENKAAQDIWETERSKLRLRNSVYLQPKRRVALKSFIRDQHETTY